MKTETYNRLIIDYLTRSNRRECIENLEALSAVAFQDEDLTVIESVIINNKINEILIIISELEKN